MSNRLLDLLRAESMLVPGGLDRALACHRETGADLASACLTVGALPEGVLARTLAGFYGFPAIELDRSVIPTRVAQFVPLEIAREGKVLAVAEVGREIVLAVSDPTDQRTLIKLRGATGRQLLPHVAVARAIERAQEGLSEAQLYGHVEWRGLDAGDIDAGPTGHAEIVRPDAPARPRSPGASAARERASSAEVPLELVSLLDPSFDGRELPAPPRAPRRRGSAPGHANLKETWNVSGGIGAGKVALVVDDAEALRRLIVTALAPLGLACVEAGDGREALGLAREVQPDLVVLDAMLPAMHGFEVCKALKGDAILRRARLLMVSAIYTGWRVAADVQSTFGADAFLEKPFKIDDLQRKVRELLLPSHEDAEVTTRREGALALCQEAAVAARAGRLSEALDRLRRAVELDAHCAEAHLFVGQIHRRTGEAYQAVAALERAVELRPDLYRPLAELAVAYETVGFRRTAREIYARALAVCEDVTQGALIRRRLEALAG
ncbi:MAG: response regulator transcription factor [Deltaproteobacteria bacterium]